MDIKVLFDLTTSLKKKWKYLSALSQNTVPLQACVVLVLMIFHTRQNTQKRSSSYPLEEHRKTAQSLHRHLYRTWPVETAPMLTKTVTDPASLPASCQSCQQEH